MFLISLQNLFSFSRKSNFRILYFQMSWRHQMPKHKTRNTFHWITWEKNTVYQWNMANIFHIIKEKISSKNFAKTAAWKLVPCRLCLQKIKLSFYWKIKFFNQATYIKYVIAKLSKFVRISMLTLSDSFLQRIIWKLNRAWNWFSGHIFHRFFWWKIVFCNIT